MSLHIKFVKLILFYTLLNFITLSCSNEKSMKSSKLRIKVDFFENDTLRSDIKILDINRREKAWTTSSTYSNKDYELNAVTADRIRYESSKFTSWSIAGKSNNDYTALSGGYGWGYGYGYGYAFKAETIEIVVSFNNDDFDLDKIHLGSSRKDIFQTFSYNDKDIEIGEGDKYGVVWINLDNIPVYYINKLSYIKLEDN